MRRAPLRKGLSILNNLLQLPLADSISQQQKQFNDLNAFVSTSDPKFGHHPRSVYTYCLHGVSLEDTKAMVKALIKWADDVALTQLESYKEILQELRKKKPLLEAEIARLEQAKQEAEKKFVHLKATSFYKTPDQAQAALQEFNKTSQLLEIEIAGIKAKIKVIKPRGGGGVAGEMRFTEEVALAGALARLQTTHHFRTDAADYVDVVEEQRNLTETLRDKRDTSTNIEARIKSRESTLANPPSSMRPVEIVGKVIIYPKQ